MGIPGHFIYLLRNLYAGQGATVRTGHGTMDWFQIGKGVLQGCILSPCLFNLWSEHWAHVWHPFLIPGQKKTTVGADTSGWEGKWWGKLAIYKWRRKQYTCSLLTSAAHAKWIGLNREEKQMLSSFLLPVSVIVEWWSQFFLHSQIKINNNIWIPSRTYQTAISSMK